MSRKKHPYEQLYLHRRRPLKSRAKSALKNILPALLITPQQLQQAEQLFDFTPKQLWLEIGFGSGEYLLKQMRANPNIGFIGCEPYLNGLAKFLNKLDPETDRNIRLYQHDARKLFPFCPEGLFHRVTLFYPDPWPKYRHHRRRFIQPQTLAQLGQIMNLQAVLHFASDDAQLVAWVLTHIFANPNFLWLKQQTQFVAPPFLTAYEAKAAAANRAAVRLVFSKKNTLT